MTENPMENGARGPCVFSLMAPMQTARVSSMVSRISVSTAPVSCPGSWTVTKAAPDAFQNLSSELTACREKPLSATVGTHSQPGAGGRALKQHAPSPESPRCPVRCPARHFWGLSAPPAFAVGGVELLDARALGAPGQRRQGSPA